MTLNARADKSNDLPSTVFIFIKLILRLLEHVLEAANLVMYSYVGLIDSEYQLR